MMKIVGRILDSFQEYENEHSLVLFFQGCDLACPECYNREIVTAGDPIGNAKDLILELTTPLHTAVVFLGGEPVTPSNYVELKEALEYTKRDRLLKTKIFTNGMSPHLMEELCEWELVDMFSIDFKCIIDCCVVTGKPAMKDQIYLDCVDDSIRAVEKHGVPLELRTTVFDSIGPSLVQLKDYVAHQYPGIRHIIQDKFKLHHT